MNILLSAFACDPEFGSDEEVGWQWACELARQGHPTWVLTRASHRAAIERAALREPLPQGLQFLYVDAPRLQAWLARISPRNHLYYGWWQLLAYRRARELLKTQAIDVVHHVTWVSFRQPSYLGALGLPFVFGPLAGGDELPAGYARRFSRRQRLVEALRVALNRLVRWDPRMRWAFAHADRLYLTSPAHLPLLPAAARAKACVELAIGSTLPAPPPQARPKPGLRLLFVGRAIGLKGLDYGLEALARARHHQPALSLTVVGDGPELARWQALARELGLDGAVRWQGWLPRDQVLGLYAEHDALLCPSLRDSGGFVVLEALQRGVPVICFKLGGPGVMVDATVGAAVEALPDSAASVEALARAVLEVLARAREEVGLAQACRTRAARYTWQALVSRVVQDYPHPHGGR